MTVEKFGPFLSPFILFCFFMCVCVCFSHSYRFYSLKWCNSAPKLVMSSDLEMVGGGFAPELVMFTKLNLPHCEKLNPFLSPLFKKKELSLCMCSCLISKKKWILWSLMFCDFVAKTCCYVLFKKR